MAADTLTDTSGAAQCDLGQSAQAGPTHPNRTKHGSPGHLRATSRPGCHQSVSRGGGTSRNPLLSTAPGAGWRGPERAARSQVSGSCHAVSEPSPGRKTKCSARRHLSLFLLMEGILVSRLAGCCHSTFGTNLGTWWHWVPAVAPCSLQSLAPWSCRELCLSLSACLTASKVVGSGLIETFQLLISSSRPSSSIRCLPDSGSCPQRQTPGAGGVRAWPGPAGADHSSLRNARRQEREFALMSHVLPCRGRFWVRLLSEDCCPSCFVMNSLPPSVEARREVHPLQTEVTRVQPCTAPAKFS